MYQNTCIICGSIFSAQQKRTKYCSQRCRQTAVRKGISGQNLKNQKISDDEILESIEKGLTRKEIADKYNVHVENLAKRMQRLGVHATYAKPSHSEVADTWHYTENAARFVNKYQGDNFGFVAYKRKRYKIKCLVCGSVIERAATSIKRSNCLCDFCEEQKRKEKELQEGRIKVAFFFYALLESKTPKTCANCGREYYSQYATSKYCSDICKKKAKRSGKSYRKRAKKYGCQYKNGITRIQVARRDKYICQICGKLCDENDKSWGSFGPNYPTLDHIIPLAKGGEHNWNNVQCACAMCNSTKRDLITV